MRRMLLGVVAALMLALGTLAFTSPSAAQTSSLPVEYICTAFEPHSADTFSAGSYYGVTSGVDTYRCSAWHNPSGGYHYYVVCHHSNNWWWEPGLDSWLNPNCN